MNNGHTRKCRGEARRAVDGIGVALTDRNFETVVQESRQPVLFLQDGRVVYQLSEVVDRADMEVKLHALTQNNPSSRGVT
jgi:hypothetical protein